MNFFIRIPFSLALLRKLVSTCIKFIIGFYFICQSFISISQKVFNGIFLPFIVVHEQLMYHCSESSYCPNDTFTSGVQSGSGAVGEFRGQSETHFQPQFQQY